MKQIKQTSRDCVWKEIPNYEGIYEVSDKGEIRSVTRTVNHNNGVVRVLRSYILKQTTKKEGYKSCCLSKNNKKSSFYVHRIVAKCFINNPENKSCVNHKNGIKTDNYVSNLEWCSYSENETHKANELCIGKKVVLNLKNVNIEVEPIKINNKNCYGYKTQILYKDLIRGKSIYTTSNDYGVLKILIYNLRKKFDLPIKTLYDKNKKKYYSL